jgi:hypothetical protein
MRMPPRKRKITGFAKGAAALAIPQIPSIGKNTKGNKAVAAKGIDSETQSTTMIAVIPNVRQPARESPAGAGAMRTNTKNAAPSQGATRLTHTPGFIKRISLPELCNQGFTDRSAMR